MSTIRVAQDFSTTPGGRRKALGPASGEEFRELLIRALESDAAEVDVVLDGVEGYGSSFLEEAFGGLVRLGRWPAVEVQRRVRPVAYDPEYDTYVQEARTYMQDAAL